MPTSAIYRETVRHFLAPIWPLLEDDPGDDSGGTISEIMVNGHDQVFFECRGVIKRSDLRFPDEQALYAAARHLAEFVGRPLGPSNPTLDARLPDGSRVNVILPPSARQGVCMTIRRFLPASFDLDTLVRTGSISAEAAEVLTIAVRDLRRSIVISGGTGTGKTSFINALSAKIPPGERILVIEDSNELKLAQPHALYFETQPADEDGEGELTIRDLVRNALRMRPDRVIVGECRGPEALDMLQAMNTGHDGSMTTVHANGAEAALKRLEILCRMNNDLSLPADVARDLVALAIDLVVQLERGRDGTRRVRSISEVSDVGAPDGRYVVRDLFLHRPASGGAKGGLHPTGQAPSTADESRP